tara:strand:+ start:431 stop:1663 length:1233 start_codon:yes stop_codon:yes gene_type:complete
MEKINISNKFKPLFELPKDVDVFIVTGGRYSQKSFAVSTAVVSGAIKYEHRTLYTRYTSASSRDSIFPEVTEKIDMLNLDDQFTISTNRIESNFNSAKIVFKGLKAGSGIQTANVKGFKDFSCWVLEEGEELTDEDIFTKILLSIRGNKKNDANNNIKVIILNPASKEHFIYKKYFEDKGVPEGFNGIKENVCYIHTSYLDCLEFVPDEIVRYFDELKKSNPKKYEHIVLGGWLDKADGVIFNNWKVGKFNEDIESIFGQDYGFSIDPTTLIEVAIDNDKKKLYVREHYGKQGLSTNEIFTLNKHHAKESLIIGDSAEPRLISELEDRGQNIEGAIKGQGSITSGISLMQDFEIIVDENSTEIIKEFNNYIWLSKKANVPIDAYNHRIDPIRYVLSYYFANQNKGIYNIL